jgi:hypothetical protein
MAATKVSAAGLQCVLLGNVSCQQGTAGWQLLQDAAYAMLQLVHIMELPDQGPWEISHQDVLGRHCLCTCCTVPCLHQIGAGSHARPGAFHGVCPAKGPGRRAGKHAEPLV